MLFTQKTFCALEYDKITAMRKEISTKFKEAFIIAFLDGKRINTKEAIELYKKQK